MKRNLIKAVVCTGIWHVEAFCVKQETLSATQQQINQQLKYCQSTMKIRALSSVSCSVLHTD